MAHEKKQKHAGKQSLKKHSRAVQYVKERSADGADASNYFFQCTTYFQGKHIA